MYQDEPHYDVDSLAPESIGAQTAVDVTKNAPVNTANVDYDTMPESTNIEDRRGEQPTPPRGLGQGGQLFSEGNQDVNDLTDYLQTLKADPSKGYTHSTPESDNTLNRLLMNTAAGKLFEWGVYSGLGSVAPRALPAVNALWMASWIASGHQLRADIEKQVKEGKPLNEITFEKGSLGDMGGIISKLQEKYKKD